jgi:hypothetical protein
MISLTEELKAAGVAAAVFGRRPADLAFRQTSRKAFGRAFGRASGRLLSRTPDWRLG